jgi:glycosyltransferase involved in cell wall biosynthesis
MSPTLSIIVPAFNCPTIDKDLKKLDLFLSKINISYEIICVIDGLKNHNDQTYKKAKSLDKIKVKVYFYPKNQGKGHAIRYGFKRAKGKVIGFFDAGSDINVRNIKTALDLLQEKNADIVVASKRHPNSTVNEYPSKRRFLSSLSQIIAKLIFGLSVSDTQVGLKLFRRTVIKKALPFLFVNGFAFDLDLLTVTNKLGFKKIYESSVNVTYNKNSTVRPLSLVQFAFDYVRIAIHSHNL